MSGGGAADGWIVPVSALVVATFAVITAHLLVAGLLPPIATEFGVDIPTAGLLISGYSLGLAILSPVFALATGHLPRKQLLVTVMAVFVAGNLMSAVAVSYWMLLGARVVVACCHGLIFGFATVMATRLAPEARRSSAVSFVVAGSTLATIAGLPLGTAIGNAFGWRIAFAIVAAGGAAAALVAAMLIPGERVEQSQRSSPLAEIRAALRPTVLGWYGVFFAFMVGVFALYAYIVPFLTEASGVPVGTVPWVLFGMGVAGFFGNLVAGRLADKRPGLTIVGSLAILTVVFLVLVQVAASATATAIVLWVGWFVGFGLPAPLRARILAGARDAPTLAAMLSSTASNLGNAAGAAIGAMTIGAGWGYDKLPLVGVLFFGLSVAGAALLSSANR